MAECSKIVAEALNSLAKSNIRGHVDDYFGGRDDVDSEMSEDESDDDLVSINAAVNVA